MATATKGRSTVAAPATKKVTTKAATASPARGSSGGTATKKAAASKTAVKKSAAKRTPAKKVAPAHKGVMLDGKPAKNRHFLIDLPLLEQASKRCAEDGVVISDVLRHGLEVYAADAPARASTGVRVLPAEALAELKRLRWTGDSDGISQYLAACHRAGWTTQALADSMVKSGAAANMSRQAVSLRVLKAPEVLRDDLPEVPELGPRRTIESPRKGKTRVEYTAEQGKSQQTTHDMSFRITDEVYTKARRRAKNEGAMMSGVVDSLLEAYINGEYDDRFRPSKTTAKQK